MFKKILLTFSLLLGAAFGQSVQSTAGGGVTSVSTASPNLTGGPITATGTVSTISNVQPSGVSNGAQVGVGSGTTIAVTPPASIVNGNLLLAFIEFDAVAGITMTPPAGWSLIATGGSTVNGCTSACVGLASTANSRTIQWVFSKVAASESGNYTFTSSAGGESIFFGSIMQVTGTTTVDAVGTATGNASNLTVAPFALTQSNDLLIIAAHQNGNNFITLDLPGNGTRQISGNGQLIATVPWGNGSTPNAKIFTTTTNAGTSGSSTNDTVFVVLAMAPSTTSTAAPFAVNGTGGATTTTTVNATTANFTTSVNSPSFFGQGNISGTCTSATAAFSIFSSNGVLIPEIAQNNAGALQLDCAQQATFVVAGNGSHRAGYGFLNSGDQYLFVSNDASQDLFSTFLDASNNLWLGCPTAACTGGTQEADIDINSQTAKAVRIKNNAVDIWTFLTGGAVVPETAGPTNVASSGSLWEDSTAHEWKSATAGSSSAGLMVRSLPGAIHQIAQTAAITTAPLCASSAGACNVAGLYTVDWSFWEDGTACGTPATGGVTFQLTWTDFNGTGHSAVSLGMEDASALNAVSQTFHFQTSNATAFGSGSINISSNGSIIQYATGYTACGVGTGSYGLDITTTRKR